MLSLRTGTSRSVLYTLSRRKQANIGPWGGVIGTASRWKSSAVETMPPTQEVSSAYVVVNSKIKLETDTFMIFYFETSHRKKIQRKSDFTGLDRCLTMVCVPCDATGR